MHDWQYVMAVHTKCGFVYFFKAEGVSPNGDFYSYNYIVAGTGQLVPYGGMFPACQHTFFECRDPFIIKRLNGEEL